MISFKYTKLGKQVTPGPDDLILDYQNKKLITGQGTLPFMQLVHDTSAASEESALSQKAGYDIRESIENLKQGVIDTEEVIACAFKDVNERIDIILDNELDTAQAFKNVNERIADLSDLRQIILDNEFVTATALSDIDGRFEETDIKIQDLIKKIPTHSDEDFKELQSQLTTLDSYVKTDISTGIKSLAADVSVHTANISEIKKNIETLSADTSSLKKRLNTTDSSVLDLITRLENTDTKLTDVSNALTDVSTVAKTNTANITKLDTSLGAVTASVLDVSTKLDTLDASINKWCSEFKTDAEDTEEVIAYAFNDINNRLRDSISSVKEDLMQIIIDNEEVTATVLSDLTEQMEGVAGLKEEIHKEIIDNEYVTAKVLTELRAEIKELRDIITELQNKA